MTAGLFLVLACISARAENDPNTGEAKRSSQNAVKKVDDGNPILQQNMMQHTMQAQMYQAQQNYAMAAEEQMKAQMLQQQIDQNDQSKQKNDDRKDHAVFSAAPAQTELKADPLAASPQVSAGGRAFATTTGATFGVSPDPNGSINKEVLVLDDSIAKQPPPSGDTSSAGLASSASVAGAPVAASTPVWSQAPVSTMAQDLKSIESDLAASSNTVNNTPIATTVPPQDSTPTTEVMASTEDLAKLKAAQEKEKSDFWKKNKTKEDQTKHAAKPKRATASTKKPKKVTPAKLAQSTPSPAP